MRSHDFSILLICHHKSFYGFLLCVHESHQIEFLIEVHKIKISLLYSQSKVVKNIFSNCSLCMTLYLQIPEFWSPSHFHIYPREEFSFVKNCSNIFWGFHIIIPGMLMLLSAIKSQWSISNWEFWITLFQCLVYISDMVQFP